MPPRDKTARLKFPNVVVLGSDICGSADSACQREWLVTNGLGSFASGTVAGILTRRYHGLLIAALEPPQRRTLLVSKVDETLQYDSKTYAVGANRWLGGAIAPAGFRFIERFQLAGTTPVWTFGCADALLEKRVWMQQNANTTFVRYTLLRASAGAADLSIQVFVNYRDFHGATHAGESRENDRRMEITPVVRGLRVIATQGAVPFFLLSDTSQGEAQHVWYRNFDLSAERCRGLDDHEDHLLAAVFKARLAQGQSVTLVFSTDPGASLDGGAALSNRIAYETNLLERWSTAHPSLAQTAPAWIEQLALAAAQFPVHCAPQPAFSTPASGSDSLIAGYPWFGEWTRDTMISLPGLALEAGRHDLAKSILRTYSRLVSEGMLPNTLPEPGCAPAYNSVDAALWYFEALRQYFAATSDVALIGELFDRLAEIIDAHVRGTRYSIHVDAADNLLYAGEPGVQLTWMDAKVGDRVITPRIGKPIEVNALWYNALRTVARFAHLLNKTDANYTRMAERVYVSFGRFWNAQAGCCFDVLDAPPGPDGPGGNDASVRPNQIFAVSLPENAFSAAQQKAIVDTCARRLLTPFGLRSLDPADPRYCGHYGGSAAERDAAYHQGTVWAWLMGPFVVAHLRVYRDPRLASSFFAPMAQHIAARGLGSISEIFDGDAPFTARGATAQAWSVGEILRAWIRCEEEKIKTGVPPTAQPLGR